MIYGRLGKLRTFQLLLLTLTSLLAGGSTAFAVGGGASAPICNLDFFGSDGCPPVGSNAVFKRAEVVAVRPRICEEPQLLQSLQGYTTAGDNAIVGSVPTNMFWPYVWQYNPGTGQQDAFIYSNQYPFLFSTGQRQTPIATLYRDNVSLGIANTSNFTGGLGNWHVHYTNPGTHTWRVDTYAHGLTSSPTAFSGGTPGFPLESRLFRGTDVTQLTPDPYSCGGSPPTPAQENCFDGIDNNGNGQVDEGCQPQTITLNQPNAVCSGTNPQISLSWTSTVTEGERQQLVDASDDSLGQALRNAKLATIGPIDPGPIPSSVTYTVLRDGQAIIQTKDTNHVDTGPLSGTHNYQVTGLSSANIGFAQVQSNVRSVTTSGCGAPASGINVEITGQETGLLRSRPYSYTARVTNAATGQPIQIDAPTSGSTSEISINFDERGQGAISSTHYESNGRDLIIESGRSDYGWGNGGGYIFQTASAACPGYTAPSSPNYLVANLSDARFSPASWAPLKLKFSAQKVVDRANFTMILAGNEVVRVQTIDTDGNTIESRNFNGPGSGTCAGQSYGVGVALDKRGSTGIAEIRMERVDADLRNEAARTNGYGIDNLRYTQPRLPTGATIAWSLVNNRIGTIAPHIVNKDQSTVQTGSSCSIATATDAVSAVVTAQVNGQTVTGTASLPVVMNDPCAPPPPPTGSAGISVQVTGETVLEANTQYGYNVRVVDNATGQTIPIFSNGSGGSGSSARTTIDFNVSPDADIDAPDILNEDAYQANGLMIGYASETPSRPVLKSFGSKECTVPVPSATANDNDFLTISSNDYTYLDIINGVADRVSFDVVGQSAIQYEAYDTSGALIATGDTNSSTSIDPFSAPCQRRPVSFSRGTSSGIAMVRVRVPATYGSGQTQAGPFGIDNFSFDSRPTPPAGQAVVNWTLANTQPSRPVATSLTPSSSVLSQATLQSSQYHASVGSIIVSAQVLLGGVLRNASVTLPITIDDPQGASIIGDIFGRSDVRQVTVDDKAVVSSGGTVAVTRSREGLQGRQIQQYVPSGKLDLRVVGGQGVIDAQIDALIRERARRLPSSQLSGTLNLNPTGASNPEGGVWHVPGDLVVQLPIRFEGTGTIIVDGVVRFEGNGSMQHPNGVLGIISRSSDSRAIRFTGTDQTATILGAYFAPRGGIAFESGVAVAQGLFVGNEVSIGAGLTGLSIQYDGRLAASPPPGFRQSVLPALGEAAP